MDGYESDIASTISSDREKRSRGANWTFDETEAFIKLWGEAEVHYALSSLRRNYLIYDHISSNLRKINIFKTTNECRTKAKCLRRQYRKAVQENSRSGSAPARFVWMRELDAIFRTDSSIHPPRTTESESPIGTCLESSEETLTLNLSDLGSQEMYSTIGSDLAVPETQLDGNDPGYVSPGGNRRSNASDLNKQSSMESPSNSEATLDPAERLAILRKRKHRPNYAQKMQSTMTEMLDFSKIERTEFLQVAKEDLDHRRECDKEMLSLLRVAVHSLGKLVEHMPQALCSPDNSSEIISEKTIEINNEESNSTKQTAGNNMTLLETGSNSKRRGHIVSDNNVEKKGARNLKQRNLNIQHASVKKCTPKKKRLIKQRVLYTP